MSHLSVGDGDLPVSEEEKICDFSFEFDQAGCLEATLEQKMM